MVEILQQSLIPGLHPPGNTRAGSSMGQQGWSSMVEWDRTHRPLQPPASHTLSAGEEQIIPPSLDTQRPPGAFRGLCPPRRARSGAALLCCPFAAAPAPSPPARPLPFKPH